jgi:hypothetical protein
MNLSRPNGPKSARPGLRSGAGQALEDGPQVEAAIEQVPHLREGSMTVLAEPEGMVGAGQRRL